MQNDFVKQAVLQFVRYVAAPLVTWIAIHFQITEDQTTAVVVGGLTYLVMFVWGLANKWRYEEKIDTALDLPATANRSTLKDVMENK